MQEAAGCDFIWSRILIHEEPANAITRAIHPPTGSLGSVTKQNTLGYMPSHAVPRKPRSGRSRRELSANGCFEFAACLCRGVSIPTCLQQTYGIANVGALRVGNGFVGRTLVSLSPAWLIIGRGCDLDSSWKAICPHTPFHQAKWNLTEGPFKRKMSSRTPPLSGSMFIGGRILYYI